LGTEFNGTIRFGGDGHFLSDYQQLATSLGVANKCVWLGELSREQVREEMQRCSFYVLPSRHETFGNVLLEVMACGKPVVATRCGGPEDIVTNEVGVLCEKENVNALAAAIDDMQKNLRAFDAHAIRQHVVDRFSPTLFSRRMRDVYETHNSANIAP